MKTRSALAVLAALGLALPAFAQEGTKKPAPKAPTTAHPAPTAQPAKPAQPDMDAQQLEWMKASAPGDNHKLLNGMIGTWSAVCKFWMDPTGAGEPMQTNGTMTNTWELGGRWVRMEFKGEMMGMPFGGLGYMGYDNIAKEYNGTWMDTMGTGLLHTKGQYDAAKKTFTMTGEFKEPGGQTVKEKDISTMVDDNTMKFEMFHTDAQGKEHRVGEITYTRAKGQDTKPANAPTTKAPEKK